MIKLANGTRAREKLSHPQQIVFFKAKIDDDAGSTAEYAQLLSFLKEW